jgi:hypothetical protein
MVTIVVHGTMTVTPAQQSSWWWRSWGEGGFLAALAEGMTAACGGEDVWKIGGRLVEDYDELRPSWSLWKGRAGQFSQHKGYFMWVGGDSYAERDAGALHLARYLNKVAEIAPDEPIRLVAHSHGCNVVKKMSRQKHLDAGIFVEQAVFLACPHFMTDIVEPPESYFPYELVPERFGSILNLYSESDSVQVGLAETLPSTLISTRWREWSPPEAFRCDLDPDARYLYEDCEIETVDQGISAHTAMHGMAVGRLAGLWLGGAEASFDAIVSQILENVGPEPLTVPAGDFGA